LMHDQSTYLFGDFDDNEWESDLAGFGNTFPHPYGSTDGKYYTTLLTVSPAGDELTLNFAKALVEAENIGQDDVTDYLSISFSSNDYVCHLFGPSSLEAEDQLLHLDKILAELFAFIDEKVGLKNTLIVFSADHGTPEAPGYNKHFGLNSAYVNPQSWDRDPAINTLKAKFGIGSELIEVYNHPYLNLNKKVIQQAGLDPIKVEQEVAKILLTFPGVAAAVPSSSLLDASLPDTAINRAILKNYHPKRSGDIYLVFEPRHFINDFDGLVVASTHGMPYNYDSYVPVIFAGMDLDPQIIHRRIYTIDIAPTLAAITETNLPSGTEGEMLKEVTD
ncbi:MAG: alkaline phosphatase family protein, partial [Opitutaceae bacterium]|nr:alkaline phosphatase family protein [Opitutaceae bacterium]